MSKRFNLFGGPGAGKSTTAAWLFSELKQRHVSVELVSEFVKKWAYQNRRIDEFDQIYIFGKQMQAEYSFLSAGVKNTITDCPVLLAALYSDIYHKELNLGSDIKNIIYKYEEKHPSINIFLNRKDKPYIQEGRYQTREQAQEIDELIKLELQLNFKNNSYFIDYNNKEAILDIVLSNYDK